jgi:chitinase
MGLPAIEEFSLFNGFVASAAKRDRIPPTTPSNLRVTGASSYSVALAWDPSTDNSGSFSYRIHRNDGLEALIPQAYTSYTWVTSLTAGQTYSFYVYAVDDDRNRSNNSNTLSVTLPNSNVPPSTPIVSVVSVGPTHISLAWSSTGGGFALRYFVYVNGNLYDQPTPDTSRIFYLLQPETTYTFVVQARDGANSSAPSAPLSVTTAPRNPNDITPPTTPAHLRAEPVDPHEFYVFWDQSTDDFDQQWIIRYDVYLNGVLADVRVGTGHGHIYLVDGVNIIKVIAIDTAGNQSAAATLEVVL